jgi:hypothetical protein
VVKTQLPPGPQAMPTPACDPAAQEWDPCGAGAECGVAGRGGGRMNAPAVEAAVE